MKGQRLNIYIWLVYQKVAQVATAHQLFHQSDCIHPIVITITFPHLMYPSFLCLLWYCYWPTREQWLLNSVLNFWLSLTHSFHLADSQSSRSFHTFPAFQKTRGSKNQNLVQSSPWRSPSILSFKNNPVYSRKIVYSLCNMIFYFMDLALRQLGSWHLDVSPSSQACCCRGGT